MKAQQIRLIAVCLFGLVAIFAAKPIMTQVMLYQENQKAKIVTPPPDYVPPINPGGMSAVDGDDEEDREKKSESAPKADSGESKTEETPPAEGGAEGK
ncbi:MAG: hypothetical protein MUC83_00900 [Pirellula sp.]|nr:hypothetical protein [Pirellula sp.]